MTADVRLPKRYRVRTELEQILSTLDEGDSVPSERDLAERFEVSRETVRQALRELLVEGRIERRGRGTVLSPPKLLQPLSLRSYTEGARSLGRVPGRRLITWEDVTGDIDLCRDLGIKGRSKVMHLERVLLADCAVLGLESTYLSKSRFAALRDTFDPGTSLYEAIRALGVQFGRAIERIETALPSPREASLLGTTTAMPMLLIHRQTLDVDGNPIERVRSLFRGDRVAFEAVLHE